MHSSVLFAGMLVQVAPRSARSGSSWASGTLVRLYAGEVAQRLASTF